MSIAARLCGGQGLPRAVEILRIAITLKHKVYAQHHGDLVVFCPHALARRRGELYVLAFLLNAEPAVTAQPFTSPRRWRWLFVGGLTGVMAAAGRWCTAPPQTRPGLEDAEIELELAGAEGEPTVLNRVLLLERSGQQSRSSPAAEASGAPAGPVTADEG